MSINLDAATARLAREMGDSEAAIADALVAVTALLQSTAVAQRDIADAPAVQTQAVLLHMNKLLADLISARGEALRVHGQLLDISREMGATEIPYCPPLRGAKGEHKHAA